ncbi:MAG: hypothetical protein RL556_149 [Actinomycetota bacterium]|jgi:hypothetical protein
MFDLSTIAWSSFLEVAGTALGFSAVIALAFALGVRLLTNAQHSASLTKGKKSQAGSKNAQIEALNRIGAYLLFAVCFSALAYGLYLILVIDGILPAAGAK